MTAGFYALGRDLRIDLEDLERQLSSGEETVLLLIHYFGRAEPAGTAVAALAQRYGAVLMEDLAHGFFTAQTPGPAGTHGDVILRSLHKMFPTPGAKGGMMTYRDPGLITGQRSTRPDLAEFLLGYDWRAIAAARRENFLRITDGLQRVHASHGGQAAFELLWPDLSETDVPQTLPVRVLAGDRDAVYKQMNEDGFGMVSLYHTLIPELRGNGTMAELARTIINFPVHQDVDPRAIPAMVDSFATALRAQEKGFE